MRLSSTARDRGGGLEEAAAGTGDDATELEPARGKQVSPLVLRPFAASEQDEHRQVEQLGEAGLVPRRHNLFEDDEAGVVPSMALLNTSRFVAWVSRYSKIGAPKTRSNAGSPVRTVSVRSVHAL